MAKKSIPENVTKSLRTTIQKILDERVISRSEFARSIDATPQSVYQWVTGRNLPSSKFITAICERYNVSPQVLMSGGGKSGFVQSTVELEDGTIAIPRFNACGSCGSGVSNDNEQMIGLVRVSLAWLQAKCPTIRAKHLEVITAVGDSMMPTIRNLDFLFIDRSENEVHGDGIYAVIYGGEVYVKRIQRQPDGSLLLISDNSRYPPILIPPDQLENVSIAGKCKIHCSAEEI